MNFIAFDLETTGMKPPTARIVEVGAVRFCNGEPEATFGVLVDPGMPIPPEATEVNGITDEMVRGQAGIEQVLSDFAAFCGDLPLVAHNAPFDCKFLLADIKNYKTPAPTGVVLDTLELARRVFPRLPSYRLGSLAHRFGFSGGAFHRAVEDSTYCGQFLLQVLSTLKARGEPHTVADLVQVLGGKEVRLQPVASGPFQADLFD